MSDQKDTHIVNGHEVPAPYRVHPSMGDSPCRRTPYFFIPDIAEVEWSSAVTSWEGSAKDLERFNKGNCFKSGDDANANCGAKFKLGKYKISPDGGCRFRYDYTTKELTTAKEKVSASGEDTKPPYKEKGYKHSFNKEDLKTGQRVTLSNGNKYIVLTNVVHKNHPDKSGITLLYIGKYLGWDFYETLCKDYDIIKVETPDSFLLAIGHAFLANHPTGNYTTIWERTP